MNTIKSNLVETVKFLSEKIGQRSYADIDKLNESADYIQGKFNSYGCKTKRHEFEYSGKKYYNISCDIEGRDSSKKDIIVIGAHYDTVIGTPGADDNASGVAGLLEIARLVSETPINRSVQFVAFSLEEPLASSFVRHLGSHLYAKKLKQEGFKIYGMISLEMIGYFSNKKNSQHYPLPFLKLFYPEKGNFISFVGNIKSKNFTKKIADNFKTSSSLPVETLNTMPIVPGVDFSDHKSFWDVGYHAFMITDTAFYRNKNYHKKGDTAETLNYDRMAEIVKGLYKALGML
ncbi:MAG: M28 family peptidase [Nitrospiraceae bacterium]|nr:M28 family peptidase [Nitrospiraceae bacterium]